MDSRSSRQMPSFTDCPETRVCYLCAVKIILIILSILLPPLAVFLKAGAGKDLLINIILCIFFYVPGILHALYVVLK